MERADLEYVRELQVCIIALKKEIERLTYINKCDLEIIKDIEQRWLKEKENNIRKANDKVKLFTED